eukprot:3941378-Rhodomonas_salina.1
MLRRILSDRTARLTVQYRTGLVQNRTGLVQYRTGLVQYRTGSVQYRTGLVQYRTGLVPHWVSSVPRWVCRVPGRIALYRAPGRSSTRYCSTARRVAAYSSSAPYSARSHTIMMPLCSSLFPLLPSRYPPLPLFAFTIPFPLISSPTPGLVNRWARPQLEALSARRRQGGGASGCRRRGGARWASLGRGEEARSAGEEPPPAAKSHGLRLLGPSAAVSSFARAKRRIREQSCERRGRRRF